MELRLVAHGKSIKRVFCEINFLMTVVPLDAIRTVVGTVKMKSQRLIAYRVQKRKVLKNLLQIKSHFVNVQRRGWHCGINFLAKTGVNAWMFGEKVVCSRES